MPELSVALQDYPDRYLSCRTINHPWREEGLPWVEVKTEFEGVQTQVVYEKFVCSRCQNIRLDQRTMQGRLIRRHYRNQANYRLGTEYTGTRELVAGERIRRLLARAQQSA